MSLIMGPTGLNNWSYLLELGNIAAFDFGYSLASTNKPISTKLGHNLYEHKISDEFYYGSSHTRSVSVVCS